MSRWGKTEDVEVVTAGCIFCGLQTGHLRVDALDEDLEKRGWERGEINVPGFAVGLLIFCPRCKVAKEERAELFVALRKYRFYGQAIPDYMYNGLVGYLVDHCPTGGFLAAVLSNDLKDACDRADDTNIHLLPVYMGFLHNYAPWGSYGSPEAVKAWLEGRKEG